MNGKWKGVLVADHFEAPCEYFITIEYKINTLIYYKMSIQLESPEFLNANTLTSIFLQIFDVIRRKFTVTSIRYIVIFCLYKMKKCQYDNEHQCIVEISNLLIEGLATGISSIVVYV